MLLLKLRKEKVGLVGTVGGVVGVVHAEGPKGLDVVLVGEARDGL